MVASVLIGHNARVVPLVTPLSRTKQQSPVSCQSQTSLMTRMQASEWRVDHEPLSLGLWNSDRSTLEARVASPSHVT